MRPGRRDGSRGRWLAAAAGTLLILVALLALPRDWIDAFFRPLGLRPQGRPATALPLLWILPPPAVEIAPPEESPRDASPPPQPREPDWWRAAWDVHLRSGAAIVVAPATPDTLPPLLVAPPLAELLAQPDTSLAYILARLRAGDRREFERVRGLLGASIHGRRMEAILDQAARVHGEFQESVEATPLPPDPDAEAEPARAPRAPR